MTHHHTGKPLLVAWIDQHGELDDVRRAALAMARRDDARLILYNRDAASAFSDPLPNFWSSQGEADQFGDPLSDEELVKQGFEPFARLVADARAEGIDAWGWLATKHGTDAAVDYAERHHASALLLPAELDQPSLGDRAKRETTGRAVQEAEAVPEALRVLLVHPDGRVQQLDGATERS